MLMTLIFYSLCSYSFVVASAASLYSLRSLNILKVNSTLLVEFIFTLLILSSFYFIDTSAELLADSSKSLLIFLSVHLCCANDILHLSFKLENISGSFVFRISQSLQLVDYHHNPSV